MAIHEKNNFATSEKVRIFAVGIQTVPTMKKIIIIGIILILSGIVSAQDTVFEQDSWYLFNEHSPLLSTIEFQGRGNFGVLNTIQRYCAETSGTVIYGIAITAKNFPVDIEGVYPPSFLLYRHAASGTPPSIAFVDSANVYDNMYKSCYFNYYVEDNSYNHAGNYVVPCYEFYFNTPHLINATCDTFYISTYWPNERFLVWNEWFRQTQNQDPERWYYMYLGFSSVSPNDPRQTWYQSLSLDTITHNTEGAYAKWGGIFPIVKLRCTAMGNLHLVEQGYRSATVAWRQNETPEQYQVSIGPVGNKPDSGAMFYTTDTFYTFTNLEPDTNYSVWVRKACRYTTSTYDTIVWSEWSNEVVFMAVGINEVEADGVRITSQRGSIVVEGAEGREVRVYDMLGREVNGKGKSEKGEVTLSVPAAGIYMVRVGELPTRKVAVLR